MCGISGILHLSLEPIPTLDSQLCVMNQLLKHRGPDGEGFWMHPQKCVGFGHRRLSIIDLTTGDQPMHDNMGNWITYNGEIYNYIEFREKLGKQNFRTSSDTEVILHAYRKLGKDCVHHLRGMFSFALWDDQEKSLFCARDRFGIKPFYYTIVDNTFYFASEAKALLPFVKHIETDLDGLKEYLAFQFCLGEKTLFKGIKQLPPAHMLTIRNGKLSIEKYWEVFFTHDLYHTEQYFEEKLRSLLEDSIYVHLRSDVPVGAYISGGIDSSSVASIALRKKQTDEPLIGFTGKFSKYGQLYDESTYARTLADWLDFKLYEIDITAQDFIENIRKVIYHLDYPVAGPGSFPQFMVSQLAARHRKVVLGGQGGDEIFGGYTRYLIAYFEQCIKGAIDGTMNNGNFVVTYESIIPNLASLRNYKPLLQEFWREGLFEEMDRRYFRLINRANDINDEIDWNALENYSAFQTFKIIFNGDNVEKNAYFDLMTHFDFKTLLPALLQVEDRMSMAHGLESRVPILDQGLIETAATIPANIKFKNGEMKYIFKKVVQPYLPPLIFERKDKMGFPTPLVDWLQVEAYNFVHDVFSSSKALSRPIINNRKVLENLDKERAYSRRLWGFLSLELWQQEFHDQEQLYKNMLRYRAE